MLVLEVSIALIASPNPTWFSKRLEIVALGITNQRETTIIWDRKTGEPVHNAIVWQDRRTASICDDLSDHAPIFLNKTGLVLDAYFSGTKIKWILDSHPTIRQKAEACFLEKLFDAILT